MNEQAPRHLLVVGAGTGGHIIPGIEVGRQWERDGGLVTYVCGSRKVESQVYGAAGIAPQIIAWPGSASGVMARVRRFAQMLFSVPRAWALLSRTRPDAVLSMGGGFSMPILLLAKLRRVPVFLHESNAVRGKVTRLASRIADRVFLGIAEPNAGNPREARCGTPVRPMPVPTIPDHPVIVVLGGSQGAQNLYETIIKAVARVRESFPVLEVHIIGWRADREPPARFSGLHLHEFVPAPAEYLARATLAISRAGSGSLCELAALGVPSILIPYPFAADRHQHANAEVFTRAGAAILVDESGLSADELAGAVTSLLEEPNRLRAMASSAKALHCPDAAAEIVRSIRNQLCQRSAVAKSTSIQTT